MPVPGCTLSVWIESPTAFIKVGGRAAAENARDFKGLVTRLHAEGISLFCVDLSQCLLMDSTFSGVVAGLTQCLGPDPKHGCKRISLVNPNARVRDLLDNLGVLELVNVLESAPTAIPGGASQEVATGAFSRKETTSCCLEAHRLLMALKPENAAKFQEVTRMLEAQLAPG
jgi:anti-anti-sigma regulatory factor